MTSLPGGAENTINVRAVSGAPRTQIFPNFVEPEVLEKGLRRNSLAHSDAKKRNISIIQRHWTLLFKPRALPVARIIPSLPRVRPSARIKQKGRREVCLHSQPWCLNFGRMSSRGIRSVFIRQRKERRKSFLRQNLAMQWPLQQTVPETTSSWTLRAWRRTPAGIWKARRWTKTMRRQFIHFEGLAEDARWDLEGSEVDDEDNAELREKNWGTAGVRQHPLETVDCVALI